MSEEQLRSNPQGEFLTEEEWSAWRDNPTTKTFWALLRKRIALRKGDWAAGSFKDPMYNAKAIGEVQVIEEILALTSEQVNEGLSDVE